MIKKAADGMYHPKGFDKEDDLQALLFLCLGGTHVADIAHCIFGTPSVSTVRRHTTVPQILSSPSFPTRYEMEHNIAATFEGLLDIVGRQKSHHAVIMFDEIEIEKQPQWDDKSNKILGVCPPQTSRMLCLHTIQPSQRSLVSHSGRSTVLLSAIH